MHGAALTFPMYMPAHGAVIEFWPKATDMWRCFEHIATMSGLFYQRWENPDPGRFRTDSNGDYTRIDVNVFKQYFSKAVEHAREGRKSLPLRGSTA